VADRIEHLAELAEQAGKLRTAEWLRTCALLPPEQWPPAPAYKGPMVPAADLAAERDESNRWRDANGRANTRVFELAQGHTTCFPIAAQPTGEADRG
jgi:hypothetical protein